MMSTEIWSSLSDEWGLCKHLKGKRTVQQLLTSFCRVCWYFYTILLSTLCKGHHVHKGNTTIISASEHVILNSNYRSKLCNLSMQCRLKSTFKFKTLCFILVNDLVCWVLHLPRQQPHNMQPWEWSSQTVLKTLLKHWLALCTLTCVCICLPKQPFSLDCIYMYCDWLPRPSLSDFFSDLSDYFLSMPQYQRFTSLGKWTIKSIKL